MARVYTYIILTVGIMILYNLAGLQTASSYVINNLGVTLTGIQDFRSSSFWTIFVVTALTALGTAGIIIGSLRGSTPDTAVAAIYAVPLFAFVGDLISIIVYSKGNWTGYVVLLVMAPLIVGYAISIFDWVRGRD